MAHFRNIMMRRKICTTRLFLSSFTVGFVILYYIHYHIALDDSHSTPSLQVAEKPANSPKSCIGIVNETIEELQSVRLHIDKLERLQHQTYVDIPGQETCQSICSKLPVLSKEEQKLYKPVGNFSYDGPMESDMNNLEQLYQTPVDGGGWVFKTNNDCSMVRKSGVAIVIVIRDRWTQLTNVLSTLIPLLRRQHLCYQIFVIEQYGQDLFNRGMLFNVGFMEAADRFQFDCVVFHDADLAPTNDLNPYGCDRETKIHPVHLGVALDVRNFKLNYPDLIGGVLKFHNPHFVAVNGHSNLYWGWGQEDDDLAKRLRYEKIGYYQMSPYIARYRAPPHVPQVKIGNPRQAHLVLLKRATERMYHEGLTTLSYRVVQETKTSLFTHLLVDLGSVPKFYGCEF